MLQIFIGVAVVLAVLGSSIWVLIDAQLLGLKREHAGLLSNSPTMWFVGCLGFWIVVFPLHLVARSKAVASRGLQFQSAGIAGEVALAPPLPPVRRATPSGAPAWVGTTSLATGIASIPFGILVGVFAAPLWLCGLALGIWGVIEGGTGRTRALGGLIASVVGFLTMSAAIVLMAMWLQSHAA